MAFWLSSHDSSEKISKDFKVNTINYLSLLVVAESRLDISVNFYVHQFLHLKISVLLSGMDHGIVKSDLTGRFQTPSNPWSVTTIKKIYNAKIPISR